MARALKMPVPVATMELSNALYSLTFAGAYKGNLEQGLQPFITTYLGEQSLAEQQALNKMSDLLREGTPRLDDILDLKAAGKLAIPTRESQMSQTLRSFSVVLAVALGLRNECYKAYKTSILDKYEHVQPMLETLADTYPAEPIYAQVLCWLQLRFHEYWLELELTIAYVDPPQFAALYEAIRYRQWMRPALPANYLASLKKRRTPAGKSEPPPRTTDTPAKPKSDGSYVANPHKIQKLVDKGEAVGKISTFLKSAGTDGRSAPVPKTASGSGMCLCYTNCQRLTTFFPTSPPPVFTSPSRKRHLWQHHHAWHHLAPVHQPKVGAHPAGSAPPATWRRRYDPALYVL
jgi:hypothetical protein